LCEASQLQQDYGRLWAREKKNVEKRAFWKYELDIFTNSNTIVEIVKLAN
jgi:hypothetical protein